MLIFASFAWVISLGFRCTPAFQAGYGVAVAFICGFLVLAIPFLSRGASDALDRWDQAQPAFIFAVAFMVVPVMHLAAKGVFDHEQDPLFWGSIGVVAMGVVYATGAAFLICKFPESRWPGRFDYWLNSHQIWHMFVVAAALILYAGLRNATVRADYMPCMVMPKKTPHSYH